MKTIILKVLLVLNMPLAALAAMKLGFYCNAFDQVTQAGGRVDVRFLQNMNAALNHPAIRLHNVLEVKLDRMQGRKAKALAEFKVRKQGREFFRESIGLV